MLNTPITRGQLKDILSKLPRIDIAALPTPLQECPRLSRALGGPKIYIKRDDLTGLAFGGNKARQLAFSLAPAVKEKADVLVHGAAAQSRQTAAAAAKLGMSAVVTGRKGEKSKEIQGNLLLDYILGADVRLLEPQEQVAQQMMEDLKKEGKKPYNTSSDNSILRAVAYVDCTLELLDQFDQEGISPDYIYTCSGDSTLNGLAVGARALGLDYEVVGMSPSPGDNDQSRARLSESCSQLAGFLDINLNFKDQDIDYYCDYGGESYGIVTDDGLSALVLFARTEGIILDPVYTAKAVAGLIDHIRKGRLKPEHTVVYLHTGGTPALFAYKDEILEAL